MFLQNLILFFEFCFQTFVKILKLFRNIFATHHDILFKNLDPVQDTMLTLDELKISYLKIQNDKSTYHFEYLLPLCEICISIFFGIVVVPLHFEPNRTWFELLKSPYNYGHFLFPKSVWKALDPVTFASSVAPIANMTILILHTKIPPMYLRCKISGQKIDDFLVYDGKGLFILTVFFVLFINSELIFYQFLINLTLFKFFVFGSVIF